MAAREFTISIKCEIPADQDIRTKCQWTEERNGATWKIYNRQSGSKERVWIITGLPEWAYVTKVSIRDNGVYVPANTPVYNNYWLNGSTATSQRIADYLNAMDHFEGNTYKMATLMVPPLSAVKHPVSAQTYAQMFDVTETWLDITYEGASFGELEYDPIKFGNIETLTVIPASSKAFSNIFTHDILWGMDDDPASAYHHALADHVLTDVEIIPYTWMAAIPDALSGPATCVIRTYIDGEDVGTRDIPFTCYTTTEELPPPIISPTIVPVNTYLTGCSDIYQYYTDVEVVANAVGQYGASITTYSIISDYGESVDDDLSIDYFSSAGNKTFTVYATDSRGATNSQTVTGTVIAATKPQITSYSVSRNPDNPAKILVTLSCNIDGCGGYNHFDTANSIIEYKQNDGTVLGHDEIPVDEDETTYSTVDNPDIITYMFSTAAGYIIVATVEDSRYNTSLSANIIPSHVGLYLSACNYGVAVGKVSDATVANHMFQESYPAYFDVDVTVNGKMTAAALSGDGTNITNAKAEYVDVSGTSMSFAIHEYSADVSFGINNVITFVKA